MSDFCSYVELNEKEVARQILKSNVTKTIVQEVAGEVAKKYGENAEVRTAYSNRVTAFVYAPYDEASKGNKLLKAVRR